MNAKAETESSGLDSLKLWTAVLMLAAAIYAFYYFEEQLLVLRVLGLLAVAGIAAFIASRSLTGKRIVGFVSGAQNEMRRVVWPTRTETVQTTLAVLVIVLLVGIFLWLLDMLLLWAIQLLTGQGS
ncbi:MAG: preprotein translocase subunit SecE [Gammaproteobacteria bacterium]|jgi:preprotein translocase subunit SecE